MNFDIKQIHDAAIAVARKGGDHTRKYFGKPIRIERKSDDSPVTKADREAEEVMREEKPIVSRPRYSGRRVRFRE